DGIRISRASRRQDFQSVLARDLHYARNFLLLLRTQRTDLLEESLEARGRDDAHEPAGRRADVTVGVGDAVRRKNRRALPGDKRLFAYTPLVLALEHLKRLVLAMMDVRWRTIACLVVRFDHRDRA